MKLNTNLIKVIFLIVPVFVLGFFLNLLNKDEQKVHYFEVAKADTPTQYAYETTQGSDGTGGTQGSQGCEGSTQGECGI